MAAEAVLRIKVVTDATQAALGLDQTSSKAGKFSSAMRKAALPAAAVGAAVVAMGKKAVDAASNLQQAEGAVEAVFGKKLAGQVEKYANSAARTMGLSAADYQNYAALVGTALQNAGFSAKQSVEESNKVMQRGADLSALYGGTTTDAVDAINAAVSRSEFDPLEKYGVSLNMTAVNAELAAKGQDKLTGAALDTAKKQIILQQIYKKTGKAAGQYAREADSVAGKQQTAAAQWENAAAALGTVLLPVVSKAIGYLANFATWAQKNTTTVQILAGALLGVAAAILVINAALKVYQASLIVVGAIQKATFLTNPIFLVVAAIVLLVAGIVLLYRRSAKFRAFVDAMWAGIKAGALAVARVMTTVWNAILDAGRAVFNWIRSNWPLLVGILFGPFGIAVALIVKNWDKVKAATARVVAFVKAAWSTIRSGAAAVGNAIRSAFSRAFSAISGYVRAYLNVYRSAFNAIRSVTASVLGRMRAIWSSLWASIRNGLRGISSSARAVWSSISSAFSSMTSRIRSLWSNALAYLRTKVSGLADVLSKPFDTVKSAIDAAKSAIDSLIGRISSLISKIAGIKFPKPPGWLSKVPGVGSLVSRSAPASLVPNTASRSLLRASTTATAANAVPVARSSSAWGAPVQINVTGALDPEAVARQIGRILSNHDRRIGVTVR